LGSWLLAAGTSLADVACPTTPPAGFDVREDPFNLSASERDAILDVVHAFALSWYLRDRANLALLFIEGDPATNGFSFVVCTSAGGVGGTGSRIVLANSRKQLTEYFGQEDPPGPFKYVEENTLQARHLISNAVVKSHSSGDVKVVADLLVTLQSYNVTTPSLPVVDYTGMIEAVLTKEWGGVWKFRKLSIYMDVPYPLDGASFRGR
jgi:hypothetical protein